MNKFNNPSFSTEEERLQREKEKRKESEYYRLYEIIVENYNREQEEKIRKTAAIISGSDGILLSPEQRSATIEKSKNELLPAAAQTLMFKSFLNVLGNDESTAEIGKHIAVVNHLLAEDGECPLDDYALNSMRESYTGLKDACIEYQSDDERKSVAAQELAMFSENCLENMNKAAEKAVADLNARMKKLANGYHDAQLIENDFAFAGIIKNKAIPDSVQKPLTAREVGDKILRLSEIHDVAKSENDQNLLSLIKTSISSVSDYLEKNPSIKAECGLSDDVISEISKSINPQVPSAGLK